MAIYATSLPSFIFFWHHAYQPIVQKLQSPEYLNNSFQFLTDCEVHGAAQMKMMNTGIESVTHPQNQRRGSRKPGSHPIFTGKPASFYEKR
jgi:hypothetical protein